MKPALLIIMLVCSLFAAGAARAVDMGMGAVPSMSGNPSLGQVADHQQASSASSATTNNSADYSASSAISDPALATPERLRQPNAIPNTKTALSQRASAIPTNAIPPAATGDDGERSRAPSWQSLLPGSIQ
ncbi:MAG: hypothetical protein L0H70_01345 [Xanthomonadales bacterium]|nr:hypothetical protein [Xanthomonadales bacterium]